MTKQKKALKSILVLTIIWTVVALGYHYHGCQQVRSHGLEWEPTFLEGPLMTWWFFGSKVIWALVVFGPLVVGLGLYYWVPWMSKDEKAKDTNL